MIVEPPEPQPALPGEDAGGDPVCWAHLVCPACGAIPDAGEEDRGRCPRCGAEWPPAEESGAAR